MREGQDVAKSQSRRISDDLLSAVDGSNFPVARSISAFSKETAASGFDLQRKITASSLILVSVVSSKSSTEKA